MATRWLLDDGWHDQHEVAALGAENVFFSDMAVVMSEVLGKPVRFQ